MREYRIADVGEMVLVYRYGERGMVPAIVEEVDGMEYFLSLEDGEEVWATESQISPMSVLNGLERATFKLGRLKK